MKLAIIGTGNVGSALTKAWSKAGHEIWLGVRDQNQFKGSALVSLSGVQVAFIREAVDQTEVIVLATPAKAAVEIAKSLGTKDQLNGKIVIDTMNTVPPQRGGQSTTEMIVEATGHPDIAKCFNAIGANIMENPRFGDVAVELYTAGNSKRAREAAISLAKDAGFADCIDIGGLDRTLLLEQFAFFWINLAMFQGMGREFSFKLLKRN